MRFRLLARLALAALLLPVFAASAREQGQPVLLISIDGLHPSYVFEADKLGLRIPTLRGIVRQGASADRVINVSPTLTYPNHTTMVTGVTPVEHGVKSNAVFDPEGYEQGAWNWYGSQIRVPTLWDAAKASGLTTASVLWPVSVAHPAIDYNLPEYWRTKKRASDSHLLYAVSTPRGLLEKVEGVDRLFDVTANPEEWSFDEKLTNVALAMIGEGKPDLLTIHLTGLDSAEHKHGPLPMNDVAKETLERTDAMIGRIADAFRALHPDAVVAIVSDHGFHRVDATVNLNVALVQAGLIELTDAGALKSWKAFAWYGGGSSSVMLKDPDDADTRAKVEAILANLARDPANGIAAVLAGRDAEENGALEGAAFLVDARGGFSMGNALTGDLVRRQARTTGAHGYRNTHPEMNSSLFVVGPGVKPGKRLGTVDMRQIAPTLARVLRVALPTATWEPLRLDE